MIWGTPTHRNPHVNQFEPMPFESHHQPILKTHASPPGFILLRSGTRATTALADKPTQEENDKMIQANLKLAISRGTTKASSIPGCYSHDTFTSNDMSYPIHK